MVFLPIDYRIDQVPFSVGVNGVIPTSIRQRGFGNRGHGDLVEAEGENFKPNHVSSKGKTSSDT